MKEVLTKCLFDIQSYRAWSIELNGNFMRIAFKEIHAFHLLPVNCVPPNDSLLRKTIDFCGSIPSRHWMKFHRNHVLDLFKVKLV